MAYSEADELMKAHWEEIAKNKDLLKLNPDIDSYYLAEKNGQLLMVTARSNGALVGYFLWVLMQHPHYKHVRVAEEDLHFLSARYRNGIAGYRFIKFACQAAFDVGADIITVREKVGHEHPAIMERLGFAPTDVVYTRRR